MRFTGFVIALLLMLSLGACASQPPRYRAEALATLDRVKRGGAKALFPTEYGSTREAFDRGESFQLQKEREDAERFFYLALLKGELLERETVKEQARLKEAARRAEDQKKAELERRAQEEAQRLARARAEAEAEAETEALAQKETVDVERKRAKPQKEHVLLVFSYTVRRGESLPLIASQPQVYGDRNLWPLLYRANRDQISDPHHIWPGQVLRIPRGLGRDDIAEAKRYAQERALH